MAEHPYDKPISDLSWATGGTKTEPLAPVKASGWVPSDPLVSANVNWRWDAVDDHIAWAEPNVPRVFDAGPEAIAATSPLDVVLIRESGLRWSDAEIEKGTKFTGFDVELVATDARHVYYVQNGYLVAALANPATAVDEAWSVQLSTVSITSPVSLHSDGGIVVICEAKRVVAFDALTGATVTNQTIVSGDMVTVIADSDSTNQKFYVLVDRNTFYEVWRWLDTPTWAIVIDGIGSYSDILDMALSPSGHILVLVKIAGAVAIEASHSVIFSDPSETTASAIACDGRRIYAGQTLNNNTDSGVSIMGVQGGGLLAGSIGRVVQVVTDGAPSAPPPLVHTDGTFIYLADMVLTRDGFIIHTWDFDGGVEPTALASDGRWLWMNVRRGETDREYLSAFPIAQQARLWLRASDGTDGNFDARPLPTHHLLLPMTE